MGGLAQSPKPRLPLAKSPRKLIPALFARPTCLQRLRWADGKGPAKGLGDREAAAAGRWAASGRAGAAVAAAPAHSVPHVQLASQALILTAPLALPQNCTVTSDGVITGWDAASSKCVPCASKPCIDCRDNYEVCKACAAQGASQQSEAEAPFYLSKNATCEVSPPAPLPACRPPARPPAHVQPCLASSRQLAQPSTTVHGAPHLQFCDFDGSKGCNMTQGCNADGTW